jgi:hypothetical protein
VRSTREADLPLKLARVEQFDLTFDRRAWDGVAAERQLAVLSQPGAQRDSGPVQQHTRILFAQAEDAGDFGVIGVAHVVQGEDLALAFG